MKSIKFGTFVRAHEMYISSMGKKFQIMMSLTDDIGGGEIFEGSFKCFFISLLFKERVGINKPLIPIKYAFDSYRYSIFRKIEGNSEFCCEMA